MKIEDYNPWNDAKYINDAIDIPIVCVCFRYADLIIINYKLN